MSDGSDFEISMLSNSCVAVSASMSMLEGCFAIVMLSWIFLVAIPVPPGEDFVVVVVPLVVLVLLATVLIGLK